MPESHDPFDVLQAGVTPVSPDPVFAADLRQLLARALFTRPFQEPAMRTDRPTRPRNGSRHGDVSYITLGLPDLDRGRAFYAAVLGWRFATGRSGGGLQVQDVVPMTGLWGGGQAGAAADRAVLAFRVDDIGAAVAAVRAHGGTVTDPHREAHGLAAEGHDDQGIAFYLHEMPSAPGDIEPVGGSFHNGDVEGDISYLTMVVPDLGAARAFYGGVLGWTFNIGRAGGAQVTSVAPQIGMTTAPEAGPPTPGAILCYRVDDIAAAVQRVRAAGGQARPAAQRPYGLETLCSDDQGTPFYLHQF